MNLPRMFLQEIKRALPQTWFEDVGADIFQQYVNLRVKLLGGRIETAGPEGRTIEYLRVERGNRPRLVFLPGFADSKENFFDPAQILVSDFDLLVPDLPGFGKSFKDPHSFYNMENYGRWICELIQEVGWTDFHLVGNSLGGAAALYVALMMPQRVKTLTVVDPAGIVLPEVTSLYHEFVDGRNIFSIHTHEQFKYFLQRVFFKPPLIPPFVWEHIYLEFAKNADWNHKVLNDLLENITDMADPRMLEVALNRRLHEIKLPTLIVWGDEDSLFPPEMGQFMKEQMPQAKLYIMPDIGHSPQAEAPLAFCQLLKKFIRDSERRAHMQVLYDSWT